VAAPAARRPRAILPWRHPVTMGCPLRSCSQRSARGRRTDGGALAPYGYGGIRQRWDGR
jgi:hypothetical protein